MVTLVAGEEKQSARGLRVLWGMRDALVMCSTNCMQCLTSSGSILTGAACREFEKDSCFLSFFLVSEKA